jgi:hypothetical protein
MSAAYRKSDLWHVHLDLTRREALEAARGGDVNARVDLARSLDILRSLIERAVERAAESRRRRKPSVRTLIKQAEKSGKPVSSVTTPEGVTLQFGAPEPAEAANPWLADLDKVTKQ